MNDLERLIQIIEDGKVDQAPACVRELLREGVDAKTVLETCIMPAMGVVGSRFASQEIFIPEMLAAARTVKLISEEQAVPTLLGKKMVLGTVEGDLHDIGKNMVAQAVLFSGIEVIDLGVDVPPEQFVLAAEQDPDVAIVGISALLTTTLPAMKRTVAALRQSPACQRFRIMVGGAPVTAAYAKKIKADYYTETAYDAAAVARRIAEEILQAEHGI